MILSNKRTWTEPWESINLLYNYDIHSWPLIASIYWPNKCTSMSKTNVRVVKKANRYEIIINTKTKIRPKDYSLQDEYNFLCHGIMNQLPMILYHYGNGRLAYIVAQINIAHFAFVLANVFGLCRVFIDQESSKQKYWTSTMTTTHANDFLKKVCIFAFILHFFFCSFDKITVMQFWFSSSTSSGY